MSLIKYKFKVIFVLLLLVNCNKNKNLNIDVSNISSNIKLTTFNDEFYNLKNPLSKLKNNYSLLFDESEDIVWEKKRKDTIEIQIQKEIKKNYGNYKKLEADVNLLFKHIKFYYPNLKEPTVYLYSSGLIDFNEPITYVNDSRGNFLFVSIDCFLNNSKFYKSFPKYIQNRMSQGTLLPLISEKIAETIVPKNFKTSNFLSLILLQGKKLVLTDAFLPNLKKHEKIVYTEKELKWCVENEKNILNYFISQNYLYSPEPKLIQRFIDISPFSKFYTEIDAESPGSIGSWLGWQIANSYLTNNEVTLQEFISINDENLILKNSKYRP